MNLKKLMEMLTKKQDEMRAILDKAKTEERALNNEERKNFDDLSNEIEDIKASIEVIQESRSLLEPVAGEPKAEDPKEKEPELTQEQLETRAFENYVRGQIDTRADAVNLTKTDNGAVIPVSIANKIIDKVVEISPIFADSDRYNVKGTISIPVYDDSTGNITMEYADEFTSGASTSGKFKSISLSGFLARAITDVSKSLINNSQFDIVSFVINKMAQSIARFIEKEILIGTEGKVEGLSKVTNIIVAAASTAVTADEIIDLQDAVKDSYQDGAYFIMNRSTRNAIRKLKDGQGNYLLNKDYQARWGYTLLGKDLYTSDNMPGLEAGKIAVYYLNPGQALATKVSEEVNIEVLREVKAEQHVVEVLGFVEFDSKVENNEAVAALKMKAGA